MNSVDIIDNCVAEKEEGTVTVGVFQNGQPRYMVFGGGGAIVAPVEYSYELANVSGIFTAAILQKLVDRDLALFENHIKIYLPTLPQEVNATLFELATHTSLLQEPLSLRLKTLYNYFANGKNPTLNIFEEDIINNLSKTKTRKESTYKFCTQNFALIGIAIERIYKASFASVANKFLHEDLHLVNTFVGENKSELKTPCWNRNEKEPYLAANGISSTIGDMLHVAQMILLGDKYFENCMKPQINAVTGEGYGIGFGWLIDKNGLVFQGGSNGGFNSFIGADKANETAVVVLSNYKAMPRKSATEIGLCLLNELRNGKNHIFI